MHLALKGRHISAQGDAATSREALGFDAVPKPLALKGRHMNLVEISIGDETPTPQMLFRRSLFRGVESHETPRG